MWFIRFKQAVAGIFIAWSIAVLVQGISRVYLFLNYATPEIFDNNGSDIARMFWYGVRYDIRGATYLFALLFIFIFISVFTKFSFKIYEKAFPCLAAFFTVIAVWFSLVNVFFYKTFGRSIDVFIFGIIEDGTKAVLLTIWKDYPVIPFVLTIIAAYFLLFKFYRFLMIFLSARFTRQHRLAVSIISVLLVIAIFALCMRGSLGTYPLRRNNSQVSEIILINQLTPGPLIALDWAYKDYKNSTKFPVATDESGAKILSGIFGVPTEPTLNAFIKTTANIPAPAKENPPHVVLAVMESMGYHLLGFDSQENDIYGLLRKHWNEDYVFRRFISEGNGTMDSLVRLLIRSYSAQISTSKAQTLDFTSNMLKPYIDNGYKVVFVTSGSGSWRNINYFIPHIGADEFVEQNTLIKLDPKAKAAPWGLPDEYMFEYMKKRIEQAEKYAERLLLICLSTTLHPPYKVPESYKAPEYNFPQEVYNKLEALGDNQSINAALGTYRYTNDLLGDFMDWLKSSSIKDHILVAVTGDHNIRSIDHSSPNDTVIARAVPFYLYIPEEYREYVHFDPAVSSSHKDIWPTLYNLSLPDTDFFNTGCNLLAEDKSSPFCFGYNSDVSIDSKGAYFNNSFREWEEPENISNLILSSKSNQQENPYELYPEMLEWLFNRQVHGGK